MKSYFKRFIVVCFTLIIIFVNISSFYYVAYADNQSSGGHFGSNTDLTPFNKLYDGFDFSDTIAKHESFYFSDSVGNKHAVARVGSAWICLFGSRATFNGTQDEQLNYYLSYYAYTGYKSIANSFSAFMASKLGSLTKGGYTLVENALSSNISTVANGISYSESDDSISIDSNSIDKLREEIKKYYYNSIGLIEKKSNGTVNSIIDSSDFRACFEYEEDYASVFGFKNYKYCLKLRSGFYYFFNDLPDYIYVSNDSNNDRFLASYNNFDEVAWRFRTLKSDGSFGYFQPVKEDTVIRYDYTLKVNVSDMYFWYTPNQSDWVLHPDWNNRYSTRCVLYSKDEVSLKFWSSYSALYNYLHGDQNAYLSSTIEKTGEDITFSIKDMNENLGNKMDTLIDSINSNKSNMSADELQNAIDKGLADLNKNTEDIKDNTEEMNGKLDSILEALNTQNKTLLEILGVTKKISDNVDDIDDTANFNTVISLCGTVFLAIQSAILYGQNTLKDDNNETTAQSLAYDSPDIAVCASGGGTSLDYRGGIFGHFPFSVIYHLYDWLKVLQTQPKCPEFSYNYGFLIGKKDDESCVITFDLSQYEDWRNTLSSFMKLSFTLAVAVGTYKKFKGGDIT